MPHTREEFGRLIREIVRGRRIGYFAVGAAALVTGVLALSNLRMAEDSPAAVAVTAPSDSAAEEAKPTPEPALAGAAGAVLADGSKLDLPARPVVPAHERVPKPASVRGLYLNAWAAGSSRKLEKLLGIAGRTEINTFVVDVKEGGEVSYRSAVPLVAQVGADRQYVRDIQGVLAKMKAGGIYPIARIVVFKDAVLARAKPEWAVQKADGSVWIDHHGDVWVDSFNKDVWDYNIAIAREAIQLGFSEVQWDYVRFPDVPASYMRTAVWPAQNGRTKADGIREFLNYSRQQLADLNVPVTADVFGLTVSAHDDMGIGQLWEKMVDATDVLLPMVYPSHFARGSYGIGYPNAEPYNVIKTSLAHALKRTTGVPGAAKIRPWLQDFTLGAPRYGAYHVRAQISAVYDAGLDEWILWNPGSNYTVEALADRDGVAPQFATPEQAPPVPAKGTQPRDSIAPVRDTLTRTDTLVRRDTSLWGLPLKPDSTRVKPDTTRKPKPDTIRGR